jgi:hypothetical protein
MLLVNKCGLISVLVANNLVKCRVGPSPILYLLKCRFEEAFVLPALPTLVVYTS